MKLKDSGKTFRHCFLFIEGGVVKGHDDLELEPSDCTKAIRSLTRDVLSFWRRRTYSAFFPPLRGAEVEFSKNSSQRSNLVLEWRRWWRFSFVTRCFLKELAFSPLWMAIKDVLVLSLSDVFQKRLFPSFTLRAWSRYWKMTKKKNKRLTILFFLFALYLLGVFSKPCIDPKNRRHS